jgi:hypothetical protein
LAPLFNPLIFLPSPGPACSFTHLKHFIISITFSFCPLTMSSIDHSGQSVPIAVASEAERANKKRKVELPQVEFSADDVTVKEETPMGESLADAIGDDEA